MGKVSINTRRAAHLIAQEAAYAGRNVNVEHAHEIVERAVGMLTRDQAAQSAAARECAALLRVSDSIKDYLAAGEWDKAAGLIAADVIAAYVRALVP